MNNKVKKLGKYLHKLDPDELKTVTGGVNADEQDRQKFNPIGKPLPGHLPGALPGVPFP